MGHGRASRGRGGEGAGQACAAEKEGRREKREGGKEKKEKEEKKEKRKKMGKRKEKEKKGGKKREKGVRERGIRAGITAPIAEPVGHAWRPGARECDARVEEKQGAGYGCRVFGGSGDLAEQGRFRKLGLGFQGGFSSSTTKQNFSA